MTGAAARRHLKLAFGGLVVALGVVALVLVVARPSDIAERAKARVLVVLSDRLEREVTAGAADANLFPPGVTIRDVRIGGGPGEPALVEQADLMVGLELWQLITSRGKEVTITEVTLRDPVVNLVRDEAGSWNLTRVLANLRGTQDEARPDGNGSTRALLVERAAVENGILRVVDERANKRDMAVALRQIDAEATDLAPGQPIHVVLSAALWSSRQNLEADVRMVPSEDGLPEVHGDINVQALSLARTGDLMPRSLNRLITGGRVTLNGNVQTQPGGTYVIAGNARLMDLALRGQPAQGSFQYRATLPPEGVEALRVSLRNLDVTGPGVELHGEATVQGKASRITFDLEGPLLDADRLLAAMPEKAPAPDDGGEGGATLPEGMRARLQRFTAEGTLKLGRVVRGPLDLSNVTAQARLQDGVMHIEQARGDIYGGAARLGGSTVDFTGAEPVWELHAELEGTRLEQAMQELVGSAPLTGELGATMALKGIGTQWAQIRSDVNGDATVRLKNATLTSADLGAALSQVIAGALQQVGQRTAADQVAKALRAGTTPIDALTATGRIEGGWVELQGPLTFTTPIGTGKLEGRVALDRRLDLAGSMALTPQFIGGLTGGVFKPPLALDVPLRIRGTLNRPAIIPAEPQRLAQALLRSPLEITRGVGKSAGQVGRAVEDVGQRAQEEIQKQLQRLVPSR